MTLESPSPSGEPIDEVQREGAIDALRRAAGDGIIDLEEFGERAGSVYAADHLDEIRAVLADLPSADLPVLAQVPDPHDTTSALPPPPPRPPAPSPDSQYVVAVMSGADRSGRWTVKAQVNVVAVMGGCKLDFRHAELSSPVTQINAVSLMGGIEIIVPEGVPVEVDGFVLMGGVDNKTRTEAAPGRPILRVTAFGVMGGVSVRHPRQRRRDRHGPALEPPPDPRQAQEVLAAAPAQAQAPEPRDSDRETLTLLFSSLVDAVDLAESIDDRQWSSLLSSHHRVVREQIAAHGGREVGLHGAEFTVAFGSVHQALRCAVGLQRAFVAHRHDQPDIHVRIGVHTGEVVTTNGSPFGRCVDVGTQIAAAAGADQIMTSAVTRQLAGNAGDLDFGEGRPLQLRGVSADWTIHELRWS